MKTSYFFAPLIALIFLLSVSCGDDDDTTTPPEEMEEMEMTDDGDDTPVELTLEEQQQETIEELTNGSSKTWKLTEAILINENGEFDISENFNVKDDEFVFTQTSGGYALTWNRGHDINATAASAQEALLDYYQAPLNFSMMFDTDSSTSFGSSNGEVVFINDSNTFTGSLQLSPTRNAGGNTLLEVVLSEKTAGDYENVPTGGVTFSEVATFDAPLGFAQQNNVGIVGSYADNSLFIAHRADCGGPDGRRSRVLKLEIDNTTLTEAYSSFNDFFTRKLNIINNDLVLTGGQNIYTYSNLDVVTEPSEVPHEAGILSRYSTVTSGDDIFVIGGDLDDQVEANKIRKINSMTGALDVVTLMPGSKVHAGSEIVNDQLYIFSGRQKFFDNSTVTTESYIYDFTTDSFETYNMPVALYNTYASRNGNLIYIAGDVQEDTDADGGIDNYDIWLGVYNTLTDEITEIPHNLDDTDAGSYIQQLTVFNGNLYVIYGNAFATDNDPDCAMSSWSIMEAAI